ncbi:hypothetical protein [Rhodococcus rhodochrous]|uniref:Uncharacterized protein n=1 Tax=Rhodococcus rhodochrous TaxID=1829 RepID=A0AA46X4C3_RHORH|nr:hypothetical protein [Rhodococcus rhodochrous]UZF48509.1 hypothetical protein KUM34_029510 [Rhodococcus rhodochrous]
MTEEWPWLNDQPVFTTSGEKHGNVTRVPYSASLEPVSAGFVFLVIGLAVSTGLAIAGIGLVIAGFSDGLGPVSWWWLALAIPGAALAVFLFSGVYIRGMELFMRERPRSLTLLTGILGGTALGLAALAAWWAWRAGDIAHYPYLLEYDGWNRGQWFNVALFGLGAAIVAVACLTTAAFAVRGARRARRDVTRILRLRATGIRWPGVVAALPDPKGWDRGGDVPIQYQDETGQHTITVRVNTWAHEIPVPGTQVIVFTDADGDLLLELDPDHPLEYHPDNRPYESDSSGGGS